MKLILITGIMITVAVCFISTGLADELTSAEKLWEGTWTDVNYSLSIIQNGSEISGIARSTNIEVNDPFLLSGTLAEDGKTLQGTMKDTGTIVMKISDDMMSYSANGTVDTLDNTGEPYSYTSKGTRNGTIINPESIWSGEWNTPNTTSIINQTGNSVTGKYRPNSLTEYFGVLEGNVSEDGTTLSNTWTYYENVTFTLADNGLTLLESDCGEKEMALGEVCLNLTKKQ